jgi:hypothetical protein
MQLHDEITVNHAHYLKLSIFVLFVLQDMLHRQYLACLALFYLYLRNYTL